MKNIIKALTGCIFSACLVNIADAQSTNNSGYDKQELAVASNLEIRPSALSAAASVNALNTRAEKNFGKNFSRSVNAEWERSAEGGFIATFADDNKKALVAYTPKGQWQHTIYYYDASQLPVNIKENVLDVYGDFKITQVNEIHIPGQVIYLVHIENTATIRTIRVCEEEIDEIETIYKQ